MSAADETFADSLFPIPISVGSTSTAMFSTDVEAAENGYEFRSANWSQSRHGYDVSTGITSREEMAQCKAWFMRAAGRLLPFRFRDPQDWSSADDGDSDPLPDDQLIAVGDGTRTKFGLIKNYQGFSREIFKPVQGTVRVAINGVEITTGFTVDYKLGIITFASAPAPGAVISAGFHFDVPVRFDSDEFTATWSDTLLLSGTIPMTEIRMRRSL